MKNRVKNSKIDWNIHAVYDPEVLDKPVDIHTHGLEKYNILNICMECPYKDEDMINYCGNFINNLAQDMINGETYKSGITHMQDNAKDWNEVYNVFDINIEKRDNGNGEEDVYVVDYWFDDIYLNPSNMLHYIFDRQARRWRVFTKDEYDKMPKDEYETKIRRNNWIE